MQTINQRIAHLFPCTGAVEWLGTRRSTQKAWDECHRAFWMLWAIQHQAGKTPAMKQLLKETHARCRMALERGHTSGMALADMVRQAFPHPPKRLLRERKHG
jgi:hypothetical protein